MLTELYSFNWYFYNEQYPLLRTIANAITLADKENIERMKLAYPVIVLAHDSHSWDIPSDYTSKHLKPLRICDCMNKPIKLQYLDESAHLREGSFFWHMNMGGAFVKAVTRIILESKRWIYINKAYPQMVAAYRYNWAFPPDGFKSNEYNAEPF